MKKLIIYAKKIYIMLIIMFFLIGNISFGDSIDGEPTDLMAQVFEETFKYGSVLKIGGYTADQVGKHVLKGDRTLGAGKSLTNVCMESGTDAILYFYEDNQKKIIDNKEKCEKLAGGVRRDDAFSFDDEPPLIAKVAKILLSITMVLAITMVIFTSLKLMINVLGGKDLKSSNIKKDLIAIIIGVLLALFSLTIINLVRSVPKSSISTSNDYSYINLGNNN